MKNTIASTTSSARTDKAPRRKAAMPATFTIPVGSPPMAWKKCAHDQGFSTVEEWARATLDQMSWAGNRLVINPSQKQSDAWQMAARRTAQGRGLHEWIESVLDAAAVEEGGVA